MMTKACDWGWITERRLREIRKVRLDAEKDRRRLDFLSREEAERLINAADPVIRPIIICALHTGMRKGEILGLRWRHVDLTHRVINLPKTKSGEPRSLPINDRLLATLKDKTLIRSLEDDHVFLNPETMKRWFDLKRQFNRAVLNAKLAHREIVFHHLRHTAASWMVMAGVPLLTVARVLGHADLQMVSRYAHLSPEHMGAAVAVLDKSNQPGVQKEAATGTDGNNQAATAGG
jgi:integrase